MFEDDEDDEDEEGFLHIPSNRHASEKKSAKDGAAGQGRAISSISTDSRSGSNRPVPVGIASQEEQRRFNKV